jgi:predicted O-methyltransferase YrrM
VLKRILKRALRLPVRIVRRHAAKSALAELTSHPDARLKAIGIALQESLAQSLSAQEREAIARIEQRRSFLLDSDASISVIDFGAGSSSSNRTRVEMEKGVPLVIPVADTAAASKSKFWATILFKFIRKLEPLSCLELGSCVGISASYQATALKLNGKGAIVTLEGSPEVARLAQETLDLLEIRNASIVTGPFHQTLAGVLEKSRPVDFFFNDGHHDHDAVIRYFNESMPYLADDAVVVFDDISWSIGMRKAWHEIEEDSRVWASIDLESIGVALIRKTSATKVKLRIPLS